MNQLTVKKKKKEGLSVGKGVRARKQNTVRCPFGHTMEGTVLVQLACGSCESGVVFRL